MTDSQTPQDLESQLAGPGGHFPGTAETLATPVGSDKPVRVKIGQADNRHLQLSKDEFRARSAKQREIDAQTDANSDLAQDPQLGTNPPATAKNTQQSGNVTPPSPQPAPKKRGRSKGAKSKPRPTDAKPEKLIGQHSPAPSTTAAPTSPIPIPTDAMLEQRMPRLERGMDMIVRALAQRDTVMDAQAEPVTCSLTGEESFEPYTAGDADEEDEVTDAPEPDESCDEPPPCVTTQVEDNPKLDAGLQALQQMILKRNPQKVFRQYWCQLSRAAQYNEWPPERRETFDEAFNSIVAHPKFVHQMSTFLRGSRSGNCIGNEQIARVCGMVAGFLTVYQLAAVGR